jgi:hypothetical protein
VGFVTFCKANLRTGQVTFSKTASFFQKPAGGFFEPAFEKPKNQRLFGAGKFGNHSQGKEPILATAQSERTLNICYVFFSSECDELKKHQKGCDSNNNNNNNNNLKVCCKCKFSHNFFLGCPTLVFFQLHSSVWPIAENLLPCCKTIESEPASKL